MASDAAITGRTDPAARSNPALRFLREFLQRPRQVCSLVPSSPVLEEALTSLPCFDNAASVVELGPGTGGTTRALLRKLEPTARLLCIEINPAFAEDLAPVAADERVIVHIGSASELTSICRQNEFAAPDVVVSGIPFSAISREQGRDLVRQIHQTLAVGGSFVAYQFRDRVVELSRDVFGEHQETTVLRNLPPLRLYHWQKTDSACEPPGPDRNVAAGSHRSPPRRKAKSRKPPLAAPAERNANSRG